MRGLWRSIERPSEQTQDIIMLGRFFFFRTRRHRRLIKKRYGMGLVYLKTDRPRYAEHHFRRAVEINPTNPVLLCCVGMVSYESFYPLEANDD